MSDLEKAARDLFDNRLGWSEGRRPYAPRSLWADLGAALYGESDPRVVELRSEDEAPEDEMDPGGEWSRAWRLEP